MQCQRNDTLSLLRQGVPISVPLPGHSGQCWHPSQPKPALLEAGTGNWFLERKFTPLLTILSATSSALTLLNVYLILLSFPNQLLQATREATSSSFSSWPAPQAPGRAGGTQPLTQRWRGGGVLWGEAHSSSSSLALDRGLRQSLQGQLTHPGVSSHHLPPLCQLPWPVSHGRPVGRLGTWAPLRTPVGGTLLSQDLL